VIFSIKLFTRVPVLFTAMMNIVHQRMHTRSEYIFIFILIKMRIKICVWATKLKKTVIIEMILVMVFGRGFSGLEQIWTIQSVKARIK
ncbi:hypothetical protein CGI06_00065, partial [Vibrio parahaemolyticus]